MTSIVQIKGQEEVQTLGAYLRDQRKQKGVSLADVAQETKISMPVLEAIEEDNYERMPAMAFCRGFYSLYADYLELDTKEILERYTQTMSLRDTGYSKQARPPLNKSQTFNSFLEPSNVPSISGRGVFIALLLIGIVGSCLYFSWNPVLYFSDKLSALSASFTQQEQTNTSDNSGSSSSGQPHTVTYQEENNQQPPLPKDLLDQEQSL